jgi:hypothetical protein
MYTGRQGPIWIPQEHQAEIASLSKAALMDMVWDLIDRQGPTEGDATRIMVTFRDLAECIVTTRRRERKRAR